MKSRNTLLLLVFLLLAGFAAYFFLNKNKNKSTLDAEDTAFTVKDTASVDKIFISNKMGQSNTIERKPGNNWVINGRYEVRKDMVQMLLETLNRMEVKRPADKLSRNSAVRDLATQGRKVEIYQNGELSKTFYVGQTTDDNLGTYFIMEGSENPYILHIPGFQGFLNTRFDLNEVKWRNVPVFRTSPASLVKLDVKYMNAPKSSFTITRQGDQLKVEGAEQADQENLKAYVDNYKFINGEYFIDNPQHRISDSLLLQKPLVEISVQDQQPANSRTFLLFPKPDDGDHLVALNPKTKDVISVQTFNFGRLLVQKEALVKK